MYVLANDARCPKTLVSFHFCLAMPSSSQREPITTRYRQITQGYDPAVTGRIDYASIHCAFHEFRIQKRSEGTVQGGWLGLVN